MLTITVIDAKSKFTYGFASSELTTDGSFLKARFEFRDKVWEDEFNVDVDKSEVAPTYSYRLEKAWDEVAIQVGESVVKHLSN